MIGPCCDSESGAVITWNLFKLDWGWLPNATAPKDGTLIQALVLSSTGKTIPIHVKYSPGPDDPGEGEGPGWFCPETGVEYWPHELKGWRHIPPIPL